MFHLNNAEPLSSSLLLDYVSINRVGKKVCLKESLVTVIRMLWKALFLSSGFEACTVPKLNESFML